FARLGRRTPRHLVERRTLGSTDGDRLRLPRSVPDEEQDGLTAYRLLAAGLAARAARGTPHHLPADPLVRDLYLLREPAAVDAHLARTLPGLRPALNTARADALAALPERDRLTPPDAAVEVHLRDVLAADLLD